MRAFYSIVLILTNFGAIKLDGVKEVRRRDGDVNVAVILRNECNSTDLLTEFEHSMVDSVIWTIHQLNSSDVVPGLSFGMTIYKTCNEDEEYATIFDLFQKKKEEFLLGLVTTSRFSSKVQKFCDVLDLSVMQTVKCALPLVKASVALLRALNWVENVTVVAQDEVVLDEFLKVSRKEWICVNEYFLAANSNKLSRNVSSEYFVIFGTHDFIATVAKNFDITNAIVIPTDDAILNDLPENTYIISAHSAHNFDHQEQHYYTLTPQLFEIATPLVTYAQSLKQALNNCTHSNYKLCLKNFGKARPFMLEPSQIIDLLKIETSSINYYIYKSDNASLLRTKLFVYNFFSDNLTQLSSFDFDNNTSSYTCMSQEGGCQKQCKNFDFRSNFKFAPEDCEMTIRTESWVFAFLSLSLLGVLLCIAILIFLLVSICRRNVLEGNPMLSILLLITVMLMYCSILPLSLEGDKSSKNSICVARALAITLSFAAAFSLILSRSILLATASKEIGFMSHVAGPVQSFLCLFIFGVQAALSFQVVNRCNDIFKGHSFIYLLSYNVMLLLLLLCLSPLIIKCQRNYKEGKYFTFAVITISFLWCIWLPSYAFLGKQYKDSVLCFGLISTASALLGTIFIPRTYLMTIAAARDKMTSALPSLAATTSAMDIYRAGTQPVYDCVNVAAINAVTVARAGLTTMQQPDLYSCPHLPEDDDFDARCDSPVHDDKVTRF
ncbi:hypothetical protein Zmor_025982 [Zophobas morio]|uniref:G-protein coupled receptors family 3 profile domain-containing protein n=1 Tax=Zophobas morio TaxID=2755281 RepID=A0AA38HSQ5_9CUCU|nr:hypothetical protein Zmor_025982 [Zophobas morio]